VRALIARAPLPSEPDQARAPRPSARVGDPVQIGIQESLDLVAELGQLGGREVEQRIAELTCLLPLLRLRVHLVQPLGDTGEVMVSHHLVQQSCRCRDLRIVGHGLHIREQLGCLPRPFPPLTAAGLLDQAVLRQLPQVERRAR
jgi:hypothetical protein